MANLASVLTDFAIVDGNRKLVVCGGDKTATGKIVERAFAIPEPAKAG